MFPKWPSVSPKHVQWMSLAETQLAAARAASEPQGQLGTLLPLVIPPCDTAQQLWTRVQITRVARLEPSLHSSFRGVQLLP